MPSMITRKQTLSFEGGSKAKNPHARCQLKVVSKPLLLEQKRSGRHSAAFDWSRPRHPCMNSFKATRIPSDKSAQKNVHDAAHDLLIDEIKGPLFQENIGFLIKALRDKYIIILRDLGVSVKSADRFRSMTLKWKLQQRLGNRILSLTEVDQASHVLQISLLVMLWINK